MNKIVVVMELLMVMELMLIAYWNAEQGGVLALGRLRAQMASK